MSIELFIGIAGFTVGAIGVFIPIKNSDYTFFTNESKFKVYKDKGEKLKKQKKLSKAIICYKKALQYRSPGQIRGINSDFDRIELWHFIIHVHTDRAICAAQECYDETQNTWMFDSNNWPWSPSCIPSNYVRPPRKESLK